MPLFLTLGKLVREARLIMYFSRREGRGAILALCSNEQAKQVTSAPVLVALRFLLRELLPLRRDAMIWNGAVECTCLWCLMHSHRGVACLRSSGLCILDQPANLCMNECQQSPLLSPACPH